METLYLKEQQNTDGLYRYQLLYKSEKRSRMRGCSHGRTRPKSFAGQKQADKRTVSNFSVLSLIEHLAAMLMTRLLSQRQSDEMTVSLLFLPVNLDLATSKPLGWIKSLGEEKS